MFLQKSFAFGLLAAGLMIAPGAALADQVAGSSSVTTQTSVNKGYGNTTGQSSTTNTIQQQYKRGGNSALCGGYDSGSQTAASSSVTEQSSYNRGYGNTTGQSSSTNTIQQQVNKKVAGSLCRY
ncbi:hypothetical protein [Iningainema tapete]|uniref:Uncharacterized protein n=1 Tax=Iningainema tapete BLCC-T55 TaxID=2748662 RepID=A0A8J6XSY4_9CYAN|nr:hypothetical protein [Iningainema tapete]MBD2773143.1 hypothetical protein [Iningainema tapete BLCC-T55]